MAARGVAMTAAPIVPTVTTVYEVVGEVIFGASFDSGWVGVTRTIFY